MKKRFMIATVFCGFLPCYDFLFSASAPSDQKTKDQQAALKTEPPKVGLTNRSELVKQLAILQMAKKIQAENAQLKQKIELLEKENALLKEQVAQAIGCHKTGNVKKMSKEESLERSIEQIRVQLDMYTKAYEYLYNINNTHTKRKHARPKLDAANALKEFKKLVEQNQEGEHVQKMNELVDGCPSLNNQTRVACLKNLIEIRDQLFSERKKMISDLNQIRKNKTKQEEIVAQKESIVKEPAQPESKPEPELESIPCKPKQEDLQDDDDDD